MDLGFLGIWVCWDLGLNFLEFWGFGDFWDLRISLGFGVGVFGILGVLRFGGLGIFRIQGCLGFGDFFGI